MKRRLSRRKVRRRLREIAEQLRRQDPDLAAKLTDSQPPRSGENDRSRDDHRR